MNILRHNESRFSADYGFYRLVMAFLMMIAPNISEAVDVLVEGYDDGVRTNVRQDKEEALIDAKRQAIERAGVDISSATTVENFEMTKDFIESKASAILLPGFKTIDKGYQANGSYLVILSGKIQKNVPVTKQNPTAKPKPKPKPKPVSIPDNIVYLDISPSSKFLQRTIEDLLANSDMVLSRKRVIDGVTIPSIIIASNVDQREIFKEKNVSVRTTIRIKDKNGKSVFTDRYTVTGQSSLDFDNALENACSEFAVLLEQSGALQVIEEL